MLSWELVGCSKGVFNWIHKRANQPRTQRHPAHSRRVACAPGLPGGDGGAGFPASRIFCRATRLDSPHSFLHDNRFISRRFPLGESLLIATPTTTPHRQPARIGIGACLPSHTCADNNIGNSLAIPFQKSRAAQLAHPQGQIPRNSGINPTHQLPPSQHAPSLWSSFHSDWPSSFSPNLIKVAHPSPTPPPARAPAGNSLEKRRDHPHHFLILSLFDQSSPILTQAGGSNHSKQKPTFDERTAARNCGIRQSQSSLALSNLSS